MNNEYRLLDDHRFDLVVVYHGINVARANCCPPEAFRDDYSHMGWYADVNPVIDHRRLIGYFTLPDTLHHSGVKLRERIDPKAFLPTTGAIRSLCTSGAIAAAEPLSKAICASSSDSPASGAIRLPC